MPDPTDSRDRILARIREALAVPAPKRHLGHEHGGLPATQADANSASPQAWLPQVPQDGAGRVALFEKNSADLKTDVIRCGSPDQAREKLLELAGTCGWSRIAAHRFKDADRVVGQPGLTVTWVDEGYEVADLESADAGITGCECLVAQTGSVLVTAASSGGRTLSVLPPHHVVYARTSQLVATLADAFAVVKKSHGGEAPAFLSFITGPSRTGDIERILVLGAHGPKRLTILLADDENA